MVTKMKIEMKEALMIKNFRDNGTSIKKFPTLHKMVKKEYFDIEYRYNIYEIKSDYGKMAIAFLAGLNMLMYKADSAKEITDFLKGKGYKTSKKFYMEDCGMPEETWNQWNGIGVEEE